MKKKIENREFLHVNLQIPLKLATNFTFEIFKNYIVIALKIFS